MATDPNKVFFDRRHSDIADKEEIWQLIYDSYYGGEKYKKGEYLFQHAKEANTSFSARKDRAVYFNQVQPLADLLSGFLFIKPPSRKETETFSFLIDTANKKKSLNEFMKTVATQSLLYTCGVLIDTPTFDPDTVVTEKDRKDGKLNPYCTLYLPFQIRDFHISKMDGQLDWVSLDNSYTDNSDPFEEPVEVEMYRLWTREYYQDFTQKDEQTVLAGEEQYHNLGIVPFKLVNWKDDNTDFISESVFEDPAMISRLIYNKLSEMDEMIAAGSFKVLTYPSEDGTIPSGLISGGIGALSAIPYKGEYKPPTFAGAELGDIMPFLKAMEFYLSEILKKIGMDTDETKDYVKSGLSKRIDFQKMRTLLTSGATTLSELETWIFATVGTWIDKESNVDIHYSTHYADEDIQIKVNMLSELLVLPFKKLRTAVSGLLVKNLLTGELPVKELDEIYKEIQSEGENAVFEGQNENNPDVSDLAEQEKKPTESQNEN